MSASFDYGAVAHPSHAAALAVLRLAAPLGRSAHVELGGGLTGTEFRRGGWLVDWTAGLWHFRLDQTGCSPQNGPYALPFAQEMAAFARAYALPRAPGTVVLTSYCGDSTSLGTAVTWVQGRDVYSTSQFGSYARAMFLASQMRPYA